MRIAGVITNTQVAVRNNLIGTDASGSAAVGNTTGVQLDSDRNTVEGNTISGNTTGISLAGAANVVTGNFIGTNPARTAAIGNTTGVVVGGRDNVVGGSTVAARNVISGNSVGVSYQSSPGGGGNSVVGNYIGVDVNGAALGNTSYGVEFTVAGTVGGSAPGSRNVISGNTLAGVRIRSTANNSVVIGNVIGAAPDGVTPRPNVIGVLVDGA